MNNINIPEYVAAYLGQFYPNSSIFSTVDPTREWTGALMIEIGEPDEAETITFINADTQTTHKVVATARANTKEEARTVTQTLRRIIAEALNSLHDEIYTWNFEGAGTVPDVRGVVSGESFYGYLELTIIERSNND